VTENELQESIDASGFSIEDGAERRDYLLLLQSADAVIQAIDEGDDYIHPDLRPVETVQSRSYWRPDDNPLNAWSHRCELKAKSPISAMLRGRSVAVKDNM
jgi:amidase